MRLTTISQKASSEDRNCRPSSSMAQDLNIRRPSFSVGDSRGDRRLSQIQIEATAAMSGDGKGRDPSPHHEAVGADRARPRAAHLRLRPRFNPQHALIARAPSYTTVGSSRQARRRHALGRSTRPSSQRRRWGNDHGDRLPYLQRCHHHKLLRRRLCCAAVLSRRRRSDQRPGADRSSQHIGALPAEDF